MTKSHLLAAIAGILVVVGLVASTGVTQGPAVPVAGAQAGRYGVALLDVSFLLKNYPGFMARMTRFRSDMEKAQLDLKKQGETISAKVAELQDPTRTPPGSAQYKRLDEQITTEKAQLQLDFQLQRKVFQQKEAEILYIVHQEIQQEVYDFATRNNIALVLNFNGDPIDKDRPEDAPRAIYSNVVWHSQGVDITKIILDRLNARNPAAARTANPNTAGPRTRAGVPDPRRR